MGCQAHLLQERARPQAPSSASLGLRSSQNKGEGCTERLWPLQGLACDSLLLLQAVLGHPASLLTWEGMEGMGLPHRPSSPPLLSSFILSHGRPCEALRCLVASLPSSGELGTFLLESSAGASDLLPWPGLHCLVDSRTDPGQGAPGSMHMFLPWGSQVGTQEGAWLATLGCGSWLELFWQD